jgi:hypothetical protein
MKGRLKDKGKIKIDKHIAKKIKYNIKENETLRLYTCSTIHGILEHNVP